MVLYKGKEISQEDFDAIIEKANSAEKLVKGYNDKITSLEEQVKDAAQLGDLKKQLESRDAELFKIKLNNRVEKISKFLESKNNDQAIIKRIGDMSDEDYDFYVEGKLNTDYLTKEELDSAKSELEKNKTELDNEKDKIIKEAQDALKQKEKKGDKLVPNSEVIGDDDMDDVENNGDMQFPSIEDLKKIYSLDDSRYDKTPSMEKKADVYLSKYGEKPEIL